MILVEKLNEQWKRLMNYLGNFYLLNILNRNIYIFFLAIETIPQKSSGISTGSIIGIIFGVLGFVIIVLILCLVWLRFQRRKMLFYKHQYFLKTGKYSVSYVIVVLCFARKINQIYYIKQSGLLIFPPQIKSIISHV